MKKALILGSIAVVALLCLCTILATAPGSKGSQPAAQLVSGRTPLSTATPKPSQTPKPTQTPLPTATPKPPPATPTPLPKIGDVAKGGGIALSVVTTQTSQGSNPYLKPKAGYTYLLVVVVIGNARPDPVPYNPLYFKLKDSSGFEYNTTLATEQPSLKSGSLTSKDTVSGIVQFEVPVSAEGFTLSYKPLVLLGNYEEIRITLE